METIKIKNKLWKFPLTILIITTITWFYISRIFSYISINFSQFKDIYWAIAFGWSTFLALYAFQLHTRFYTENPEDITRGYGKIRWSQKIHQFVFNFSGGIIGFVIIYLFLYTNYLYSFEGWEKVILLLIAFLGIMGYLPYTFVVKNWFPSK